MSGVAIEQIHRRDGHQRDHADTVRAVKASGHLEQGEFL